MASPDQPQNGTFSKDLTIVVAVVGGLPAAGKSTLVRGLLNTVQADQCVHLEYDQLQEEILLLGEESHQEEAQLPEQQHNNRANAHNNHPAHHPNNNNMEASLEAWRKSRSLALEKLSCLLQENITQMTVHQQHQEEEDGNQRRRLLIVLDDNFHLRSMRKQVFQICQQAKLIWNDDKTSNKACGGQQEKDHFELYFATLWLGTCVETCLERNSKRHLRRQVSDDSIRRILESCEPPKEGAATWETNILVLHKNDDDEKQKPTTLLDCACTFLDLLLDDNGKGQPVPMAVDPLEEKAHLERERAATLASKRHQLDQRSRQWIKAVATLKSTEAKTANQVRKDLLKETKLTTSCSLEELAHLFVEHVLEQSTGGWSEEETAQLMQSVEQTTH